MALFVRALASATVASLTVVAAMTTSALADGPKTWSGIYLGGQAGFGFGKGDALQTGTTQGFANAVGTQLPGFSPGGGFWGGQIGVQQQIGSFVYGVETTLAGTRFASNKADPNTAQGVQDRLSVKQIGTLVGRIGYGTSDWMAYAKGGYAYGTTNFSSICPPPACVPVVAVEPHNNHGGYALGAGVDWRLKGNWTLGLDYTFAHLNASQATLQPTTNGVPFAALETWRTNANVNMVGLRLNYQFGRESAPTPAPLK